jgi:hypothetical protein
VFAKRLVRTEQFHGLHHLAQRAQVFEDFHNAHHRYWALRGATPSEWQARWQWTPCLLDPTFTPPTTLPRRGQIDFVRLIRSDRLLKILGAKLPVPETLVHRYLTATLHLRRERLVATCEDLWRMEVPFIQAVTATMPCCLRYPASERCAAMHEVGSEAWSTPSSSRVRLSPSW